MGDSLYPPKINLLNLSLEALTQFFCELGEKPFRAKQIFKWIHQRGVEHFSEMTDLSKALRERLPQLCEIVAPEIDVTGSSTDGTRKWLMCLADGNRIETVFIPEANRGTLCISSQVGCTLNCRFCSTGKQGFNRNLTTAEIIGQIWQAKRELMKTQQSVDVAPFSSITNVVMMGMGEPLLNFESVVTALSIMREDAAYALPRRRVTLSTAGVVPNIDRLSVESDVALAVSLHAPNDELRDQLVPLNKKYRIAELIEACKRYVKRGQKITFEYVMLRDVNDTVLHAKELVKLLSDVPCKMNLIPFNPFKGTEYLCSLPETIETFRAILIQAGFVTTVRKTRGADIDAACGQLRGRIQDKTRRNERWLSKQVGESRDCLKIRVISECL